MSDLLKFIQFKDLTNWSVNHYISINNVDAKYNLVKISEILKQVKNQEILKDEKSYQLAGIHSHGKGLFHRTIKSGKDIRSKTLNALQTNQFVYSRLGSHTGSFDMVSNKFNDYYVSNEMPTFEFKNNNINPYFLKLVFLLKKYWRDIEKSLQGTAHKRFKEKGFLNLKIPLPPLEAQQKIVKNYQEKVNLAKKQNRAAQQKETKIEAYLYQELGIELPKEKKQNKDVLQFVSFKDLQEWGHSFATNKKQAIKSKYSIFKVDNVCVIGSGGTPSRDNLDYYKGNIPWVKTTEVRNNCILNTFENITKAAVKDKNLKLYPKGSLIMAMYGQGLTRGRMSKLNIEATTNQACAVFYNFSNKINVDYLWFYLQNEYDNLRALASGNNQPNLNSQKIKNYPIVVPPLEVQNKIASHIQNLKNEIQGLKQQAEQNQKEALSEFEAEIFNAAP
ncbi:restriction endonuclease subunit S [Bathymodiolus thermophilus thioautotrophic gill symbiont]|nr:restriction endonuclease subunit S [Bathymodiolus thermophilus thioautotrophic gill symbiont]